MRLKEFRIKKGLTQREVAKKLNITPAGYSHYEIGRSQPDIEMLKKLADIFQTTVDSLLDRQVPYLLDKSLLSKEQVAIVEQVQTLSDKECKSVDSFIKGLKNRE